MRIRGHTRVITLRNGTKRRQIVREHVRDVEHVTKPHRLTNMPSLPLWQWEHEQELNRAISAATGEENPEYRSPEESAAQAYMERQQRLLHMHRRRK